jgi:hypothetical protein
MKAYFLRDVSDDFVGKAKFYNMVPPIKGYIFEDDRYIERAISYIIVSQAKGMFSGYETYIFPATPDGEVEDWSELSGSRKGFISPDDLLIELGYEIIGRIEK